MTNINFHHKFFSRLKESPIAYRLANGMFWVLLGTISAKMLGLLTSVIVARILGKVGFGEFGIIQSTTGLFTTFAGMGTGITLTKYISELRHSDPEKVGRIFGLSMFVAVVAGVLFSLVMWFSAPWLATKSLGAPRLIPLLQISSVLLIFSTLNGVQAGVLAGLEAFRASAALSFWSGLINTPVMLAAVYIAGLPGAIWGLVISSAVTWLLYQMIVKLAIKRENLRVIFNGCLKEWKILITFSVPAVLAGALIWPVSWLCQTMLVQQPNGFAELGEFNASFQWFNALLFLPGISGNVLLPILSSHMGQKNNKVGRILNYSILLNVVFVFPLIIFGSILSPWLMRLYGIEYKDAWPTLVLVLITAGLVAIQLPVSQVMAASGRMWLVFWIAIVWALVFVMTTSSLVKYGAFGLAMARLISNGIQSVWTFGSAYRIAWKSDRKKLANI